MKPNKGIAAVKKGKLKGETDNTEYFYFICPTCNDSKICRVLNYEILRDEKGNPYNDKLKSNSKKAFVIRFDLFCEDCRFRGPVKISSIGWQCGTIDDARKSI